MALGLTQPLTEMSTKNISWGLKSAVAYHWQSYHLHVLIVFKSENLNLLERSVPVKNCNGNTLALQLHEKVSRKLLLLLLSKTLSTGRSICLTASTVWFELGQLFVTYRLGIHIISSCDLWGIVSVQDLYFICQMSFAT